MKHLRETFTEEEWAYLQEAKKRAKMNWHNLIYNAIFHYDTE